MIFSESESKVDPSTVALHAYDLLSSDCCTGLNCSRLKVAVPLVGEMVSLGLLSTIGVLPSGGQSHLLNTPVCSSHQLWENQRPRWTILRNNGDNDIEHHVIVLHLPISPMLTNGTMLGPDNAGQTNRVW